jgi:D-cysteine desulfhydrase family pyridoxal phosphate-dependent enzyme
MKNIPRLRFAHLPTHIEPLPRLSSALGGPELFVKRDDQTGLAFGGNKTRKLEFLLAEAMANGARTLITAGAIQSNHCRQTAAAAARFGFDCTLVLTKTLPASKLPKKNMQPKLENNSLDERNAEMSGNLLLDNLLGAEIVWAENNRRDEALNETFQAAWQAGKRPYLIPYGGSNQTGAAAFVYAMKEMLDQCAALPMVNHPPDWIIIPSSSGGTQSGLVLGASLFGFGGMLLGISIDEETSTLCNLVARLANDTAEYLGEDVQFSPDDILVNDDYLGGGYGVLGEPEREAIALLAKYEGLLLDPVYTGRAAAGMLDLIRKGYFKTNQRILFWHTGGTPALFADKYRGIVGSRV